MPAFGGLTTRMVVFMAVLTLSAALTTAEPLDQPASATLVSKFGTTNDATYPITPLAFSPVDSTMHYLEDVGEGHSYLATTTPYGAFFASPELPSGSLLVGLKVYYCNENPPGGDDFLVNLESVDNSGNFQGMLGSVTAHANDGCTSQFVDLTGQNYTVFNHVNRLLLWTIFGPNPPVDPTTVFLEDVTLTYRLQVSRAPLTPTFSDVPASDPGYSYVEALAASGITAGCGGGNFCPDQSITRRQMAVFLSRALGLAYRFGTVETTLQVPEWRFRPISDSITYEDTGPPQLSRYAVSAPVVPVFESEIDIPTSAVLDEIDFDYCDDRPAASEPIDLQILGNGFSIALDSVPGAGCGSAQATNIGSTNDYSKLIAVIRVGSPFGNSQARFQGVRFTYHLQVSPAPATATFADVPTSDSAFAEVEALAASGITGGCGGGNFCPGNPVTRRQMAIFLAKALGLFFN